MIPLADIANLAELAAIARARTLPMAWDYYDSGADDERCVRDNKAAFTRRRLAYRTLVDVAQRDTRVTLIPGTDLALPIAIAPTAFHRLAHRDGELASVRAAGALGTLFILSTLSNTPVEDVVAAATGPVWFQLYVYRDRAQTEALVRRVEAAGVRALVLTVDAPLLGRRERDVRNRFALPPHLEIANLHDHVYKQKPLESGLAAYFATLLDPTLDYRAISWLRSITTLPIFVKGIVRADDALRAIGEGAAGVVVSNHGGRQLDPSPATIDALPHIADAIPDHPVLLDGGVRRGTDVAIALAAGARAVLVGRPVLHGLAAGGQAGVEAALKILRRELDLAMALCGAPSVAALTRDLLSD